MKYELSYFELLIKGEVLEALTKPTHAQEKMLILAVRDEVDRIKISWKNQVLASPSETWVKRYIQHHQKALIQLVDKLLQKWGSPDVYLNKVLSDALEELHNFIETCFPGYFNLDERVTSGYVSVAKHDLEEKLKFIRKAMKDSNVESIPYGMALEAIENFIDNASETTYTYRNLIYMKELLGELIRLVQGGSLFTCQDADIDFMFYVNFNSPVFIRYYTHRISDELKNENTLINQQEKLAYEYKLVNQKQIKPGLIYIPELKNAKALAAEWITEEISYLREKQRLATTAVHSSPDKKLKHDFKIMLDMSVSQFACLIRTFMEVGVIQNKNITELVRLITSTVQTKRSENISQESFRMKFYNIESGTKESLKMILNKILEHLIGDEKQLIDKKSMRKA